VSPCTGVPVSYENQTQISIYPNPNNGRFNIFSATDMELSIINELGQIIQYLSLNDLNDHRLELQNFANGIYFVVGIGNGELIKQKIIVDN
jgi:hypothetical protein